MRVNPHTPVNAGQTKGKQSGKHGPCEACPIMCRGKKLGGRARKGKEASARKNTKSSNYCYQARITAAQKMTATVGSVNEQLPRCDAAGRHEPEKNELPPPTLGGEGRSKLQGPPLIGQRLGRRASAQSSRQHPKHMCFQQPWG